MNKLNIHFENCYGIKKLKAEFDFQKSNAQIIYAPNGSMKSSFTKTFEDISIGEKTVDRIFTNRINHRSVQVDGIDIKQEEIFIINRMKEPDFKEISTILVNDKLKNEYDEINLELYKIKQDFLKTMKPYFNLKENEIEKTIEKSFKEKTIYDFIENQSSEINRIENTVYTNIIFNDIFNDKAYKFLSEKSFNIKIREYIDIYDRLVSENNIIFQKGNFNHYNADSITKSLKDNGFFKAQHKVKIKDIEIGDIQQLEELIKKEKDKILNSPDLTAKFNEIDKALNANNELRSFRSFIENNKEIIKEFVDLENLKKKLILNYIAKNKEQFNNFVKLHTETKIRRMDIISQARNEQSDWKKVIDIFRNRFSVPFEIKIINQDDIILKNEPPSLIFTYKDGDCQQDLGGKEINVSLSTGEQRVFYILNIIFQIEARKKMNTQQLIIVDDIADSFDYKNKYAIIQYLKDIADDKKFKMIILTHNFDFYKTIKSRIDSVNNWEGNFKAIKNINEIKLEKGEKKDIFPHLRENYAKCDKSFIACIPFVRNLIEYTSGSKDNYDYLHLTHCLHIKPISSCGNIKSTKEYTKKDLLDIFNKIFCKQEILELDISNQDTKIYDLIISIADNIYKNKELEILDIKQKLCLSIAIRYKTEDFIINKVIDKNFHANIHKKETGKIIEQYRREFPNDKEYINIFDRVNLMTPENLHMNSFMYEPLMDLSEEHLIKLYEDVSNKVPNQKTIKAIKEGKAQSFNSIDDLMKDLNAKD